MENNLLDDLGYLEKEKPKLVHVGFFLRLGAMLFDVFVMFFIMFFLYAAVQMMDGLMSEEGRFNAERFIIGLIFLVYFPVMESSKLQGSFGKHQMGIKVVDIEGNGISLGRATARFVLKFVSFLIVFLGFVMIAFTKDKQGLHDMITETYVVEKQSKIQS